MAASSTQAILPVATRRLKDATELRVCLVPNLAVAEEVNSSKDLDAQSFYNIVRDSGTSR